MAPTANASCSPGMSLRPIPGGSARPWCSHSQPDYPCTPISPYLHATLSHRSSCLHKFARFYLFKQAFRIRSSYPTVHCSCHSTHNFMLAFHLPVTSLF